MVVGYNNLLNVRISRLTLLCLILFVVLVENTVLLFSPFLECAKLRPCHVSFYIRPNITQRRSVEKVPINDWQASVTLILLVFHRLDLAS